MTLPVKALLGCLLLGSVSVETVVAQFNPPPLMEELLVGSAEPVRFGDGAWGDYDGDGDFDLALSGNRRSIRQPEAFTQLYRNDGDTEVDADDPLPGGPTQVPATQYISALNDDAPTLQDVWQSAVAWADYDNDGDLDLAVSGLTQNGTHALQLYTNTGEAIPLERGPALPGLRRGDLAWADYDNDGDLDLAVCGLDAGDRPTTVLYENQWSVGVLAFEARATGLPGLGDCSFDWGDYDGDGDLDALLTGVAEPQTMLTQIYRNEGGGSFTESGARLEPLLYAQAAWGDYDGDGDLDVLVSGAQVTPFLLEGQVRIYRNDAGVFVDVSGGLAGGFENDETEGRYGGAVGWGDYDNDGLLDFFITGARTPNGTQAMEVYHTGQNDRFTKSVAAHGATGNFEGGILGGAFWGDYDGDGDLDLFLLGQAPSGDATLKGLRNYMGFLPNTPPTAPTGLQATALSNTVTLAWNPADDAQTPTAGLSYNLRVGTQPGGLDVVSPMALVPSGQRLVSGRGNAEHNTAWGLRGLAPGTYYWSVQALDASFKGSPFAQEGSFTITAGNPSSD